MSSSQNISQYLRQSYSELAKAEKVGDYERCLKTCSKILKYTPNDVVAQQCKVIALVQLRKFDDAILAIKKNAALSRMCVFEKAYCEYRLNHTDEAIKTLKENSEALDEFRCKELLAQLLYRSEEYRDGYDLYIDLLKNSEDDYDEERRTNLAATVSYLAQVSPSHIAKYAPSLKTYEQYYNESCRLCALQQYQKSIERLDKAESICRKILAEDDVPEEEIQDEICCIRLQKAYCQQLLGKTEESLKVYTDVSKKKPSDVSLIAVASNNFVSIKKESNLFDARKKMKSCQNAQIQQKLNRKQKEIICYNSILVNLHSNQLEPSRKLIDELKNYYNAHELSLLCEAALLSKQKDVSVAIRDLENYSKEKGSQCSLDIYYTLVQLYLNEGMTTQAVNALQSFDGLKTSPGLLSILVSLFLVNNDRKSASDLLKLSIDEFEKLPAKNSIVLNLLEEGSAMYIGANDFKSAAKYLEDLIETNPNDPKIIARLINAYLRFDPAKAENLCKSLPDLDHLTQGIDVDKLENAENLLLGSKYGAKKAAKVDLVTPKIEDNTLIAQKKKKRNRKIKLPQKYDPNIPPDPERWLPKYERSTYKKRKDKRAKDRDIGRGTQGAVSGGTEFDSTVKTDQSSTASPKPGSVTPAAPGPRQQRPLAQKPKKKKKAGKWT